MRHYILLFLCLFVSKKIVGQDSLQISTEIDTSFKRPQYYIAYNDAETAQQTTTRMFKFDPLSSILFKNEGISTLKLEYEQKIKANVSLNVLAGFQFSFAGASYLTRNIYRANNWFVGIEPRYYYKMSHKTSKKQGVNNLSGNYFGLKMSAAIIQKGKAKTVVSNIINDTLIGIDKMLNSYRIEGNYGIQRRVFKHGYINFSFGAGLALEQGIRIEDFTTKTLSRKTIARPFISNNASFGWVFGGNTHKSKQNMTVCDVFRCFEEEDRLLKIDLISFTKVLNFRNVATETSVNYEFWLDKEGNLSLNTGIHFRGEYLNAPPKKLNAVQTEHSWHLEGRARTELRYYYDLKKRIAQGKSVQNFSANYIGVPLELAKINYVTTNNFEQDAEVAKTFCRIGVVGGIQRRLFKNGYVDFSFGPAYNINLDDSNRKWRLSTFSRFQLGLAF